MVKILTCNIRCTVPQDGADNWPNRKAFCMDIIKAQDADILCFQELTAAQGEDVSQSLAGYHHYGMADEPLSRNRVNSIFYRADAFDLISSAGYWLSETPHIAGSRSWHSAYVRLANWVRLTDRASGTDFRVINTHLDCDSQPAREGQARCIVEDAAAYPDDYPQLLAGDMNCDATNHAIAVFKSGGWRDTYAAIHRTEDPGATGHDFLGPAHVSNIGKMDWVFSRGKIRPADAQIVTDAFEGRYPSDHYFVSATVMLNAH